MPKIDIELQPWTAIPKLRKSKTFKSAADELIAINKQIKLLKGRQSELSLDLYDEMNGALDDGVKSIAIEGGRLEKRDPGEAWRLDAKKLLKIPMKCGNPKCKQINHVTPDVLKAAKVKSDIKPGVRFVAIGAKEDDEEVE